MVIPLGYRMLELGGLLFRPNGSGQLRVYRYLETHTMGLTVTIHQRWCGSKMSVPFPSGYLPRDKQAPLLPRG